MKRAMNIVIRALLISVTLQLVLPVQLIANAGQLSSLIHRNEIVSLINEETNSRNENLDITDTDVNNNVNDNSINLTINSLDVQTCDNIGLLSNNYEVSTFSEVNTINNSNEYNTNVQSENCHQLADSWFDSKTVNIENYEFNDIINSYFSFREQDFILDKQTSQDIYNFVSSEVREDIDKRRTLTALMQENMNIKFLDAVVIYDILSIENNNENSIKLNICEWSFYDYDDLNDDIYNIDTSGFETNHNIIISKINEQYIIIQDDYTEDDMTGMISCSFEHSESDETESENYNIEESDSLISLFSAYSYSPDKAVAYADTYWQNYNPNYSNYNSIGGDCANFVSQCLHAGGIPMDGNWYWYSYSNRSSSWSYCPSQRNYFASQGTLIDNPSSSQIRKGNPVWYYSSSSGRYSHAAICVGTNSAGTPVINAHNNNRYHVSWKLGNSWSKYSTVQLSSAPSGYNPEGVLDSCTGGSGKINLSGWAFDRDDTSQSLEIHVYIGGAAGDPNAEGHNGVISNLYRPDVNNVYGVGDYHGFSTSINTNKTGTQDVYVYAINIGNGNNVEIGHATVNITPRVTKLKAWVSDTKMGDEVTTLNTGQIYYLCYKIYDDNTGDYFGSYSSASYTVTETVYDASGNVVHSNPYETSNDNWIGFTPGSGGSWTGEVKVTGEISGVLTISFDVIERISMFHLWVSDSEMGEDVSMYKKDDKPYFNCEVGKKYYACYKMYDKNSGDSYNSYAKSSNYKVTLTFYNGDNSEIGSQEYNNSDNNCIGFTTVNPTIVTCKATITGDLSGETSVFMDISDDAKSKQSYSISYNYNYNGGTSATKTSASVLSGEHADLTPIATKKGWDFIGWNTDKDATEALSSYTVTKDTVLYAIYRKTAKVTFVDADGTFTQSVDMYNNSIPSISNTLNGYRGWTALGWRTDTQATRAIYTGGISVTGDMTLYAVYQRNLTLTYNANGGSSTPSKQTQVQYYNAFGNTSTVAFKLAASISRNGYIFDGWLQGGVDGAKYTAGSSISINEDTTMYADWTKISNNEGYPYIINSILLKSNNGIILNKIPVNTEFIVNTNFTKTQTRKSIDYLIIAIYDTNGQLIKMDYVLISPDKDDDCEIDFMVSTQPKSIGKIKTFIWNTIDAMTPLSESKSL